MTDIQQIGEERARKTLTLLEEEKGAAQKEKELELRFSRPARQAEKVTFEFTRDPALLQQYYRIREQMYNDVWHLTNFDGSEDEFDRQSHILIARIGKQCVGGLRIGIKLPRSTAPLPMEAAGDFDLRKLVPEMKLEYVAYAELSRYAFLHEYSSHEIMAELSANIRRKLLTYDVHYAFMKSPLIIARRHRVTSAYTGEIYKILSKVNLPEHEEHEGIRMVLSYIDYTDELGKKKRAAKVQKPAPEVEKTDG